MAPVLKLAEHRHPTEKLQQVWSMKEGKIDMRNTPEDPGFMVSMTHAQAVVTVPALRCAERDIHNKDDDGMQLITLSDHIAVKLAKPTSSAGK